MRRSKVRSRKGDTSIRRNRLLRKKKRLISERTPVQSQWFCAPTVSEGRFYEAHLWPYSSNPTRYQIHGSHQCKVISAFSARALPIAVISRSSVLLRSHICTQTFMYGHVQNGVLTRGFIASDIRIFQFRIRSSPKIGKN